MDNTTSVSKGSKNVKSVPQIYNGLILSNLTEQEIKKDIEYLAPFYNDLRLKSADPKKNKVKFYTLSKYGYLTLEKLIGYAQYKEVVNSVKSEVFPGYGALAKKLGCSIKTAQRSVGELVKKGLIVKLPPERTKKKSNRYHFTVKIEHLATLTRKLEGQEEVTEELKSKIDKEPVLQGTLSELGGAKGQKIFKVREKMKDLYLSLKAREIEVSEFISKQDKLLEEEKEIRKESILPYESNILGSVSKLNRDVSPGETECPSAPDTKSPAPDTESPAPDTESPEILSHKSSDDILTEPNNTTTHAKPTDISNKVEISSSIKNYLSSLGFKFTKSHLEKTLPELLDEFTEEEIKKHIEALKTGFSKEMVWHLFVFTTFSIRRLFEDETQIIHGLKGEFRELHSRIEAGELLGYKNFKKFFKTEEEALKTTFPMVFEARQEAKKSAVMRTKEYSEEIRNEFLALSSFQDIRTPDEAKENFYKYVQEKHPEAVKSHEIKKQARLLERKAFDLTSSLELDSRRLPVDTGIVLEVIKASCKGDRGEKSLSQVDFYENWIKENRQEFYQSWLVEREREERIALGRIHHGNLPREIRYSDWGIDPKTKSEDDRMYAVGHMWQACGFTNETVLTGYNPQSREMQSWLNENYDGLYDKFYPSKTADELKEAKISVDVKESHTERIDRLLKETFEPGNSKKFSDILTTLTSVSKDEKEEHYPSIQTKEDLIKFCVKRKGGK